MTSYRTDKPNFLQLWVQLVKMTLKIKFNDLHFQISIPVKSTSGCIFGANLMILAQIYAELSHGQYEFPRILSQNGQNDLEVKVNDPYFQYQLRVSHDACLVQIWWFQLKFGYVKFTDRQTNGRTYGQTQAKTIPLRPERSRSKMTFFTTLYLYIYKCPTNETTMRQITLTPMP